MTESEATPPGGRGHLWVAAIALTLWAQASGAHQAQSSYTAIAVSPDSLRLTLSLDEADVYLLCPQLDRNGDRVLWAEELLAGGDTVSASVLPRLTVRAGDRPLRLESVRTEVTAAGDGIVFLRLQYRADLERRPSSLQLDFARLLVPPLPAEHRALVRLTSAGQPEALAVLSRETPVHPFPMAGEPEGLWTQIGRFIGLGVEHIFLGYDHILFLIALIVVGSRLGELIRIVSAFTVAHSITLVLATLEWVTLPSRLVESGIALSIVYVAAENFWLQRTDYRWVLTFCFGFVHGFGFANVLRDLGLPARGLMASLLSFNVGVEVGQVAIVAILFPVVLRASRSRHHRRFVHVVSAVVLLFGLGWLVERAFDLSYMPV